MGAGAGAEVGARTVVFLRAGTVDFDARAVYPIDGSDPVPLNEREVALLSYLLDRPGRAVPRQELLREVWGVRSRRTRALDMCVRRLRVKLERDPSSPEHLHTVRGMGYRFDPGVAHTRRPPPAVPEPSSTMPTPPGPLFGRRASLAAARCALEEGQRLITLTGPPGIGKTRLALELAHRLPHARFCPMAEVDTGPELEKAVAAALGLPPRAELAVALRSEPMLLVLDNLEQIARPAALRVVAWLAACPALQVLATSREALGAPEELEILLDALAPDEAASLIRHRTADRWAHWARAELDALCRLLDGNPLALELAAARSHQLTPPALCAALEDSVASLHRPSGTTTDRHRSYADTASWSWRLLEAPERRALHQLCVFVGPFDRDAALAVLDGSDDEATLASLQRKSLVGWPGLRQRPDQRLQLPVMLRRWVREERGPPEHDEALCARHRAFHVALARTWDRGDIGPPREHLVRAGKELWEALQRCTHGHAEPAAWLAHGLQPWFGVTGRSDLQLLACDRALSLEPAPGLEAAVRLVRAEARIPLARGDALGDLQTALALAESAAPHLAAPIHRNLAYLEFQRLSYADAACRLELALTLDPDPHERMLLLHVLAQCNRRLGRLERARALFHETLTDARRRENREAEGSALMGLSRTWGATPERTRLLLRAFACLDRTGTSFSRLFCALMLVLDLAEQGRHEEALAWARWTRDEATRTGNPVRTAESLLNEAQLLLLLDRAEEAEQALRSVERIAPAIAPLPCALAWVRWLHATWTRRPIEAALQLAAAQRAEARGPWRALVDHAVALHSDSDQTPAIRAALAALPQELEVRALVKCVEGARRGDSSAPGVPLPPEQGRCQK